MQITLPAFSTKKNKLAYSISLIILGASADALAQTDNNKVEEEVLVTGIRSSLIAALDSKRNSTSIIDAINSEDIGKFPDKNVADSLQRIPGISVDRIWGEGRDIFVRGTDSTMNRTLMNGQNVSSAYWWANDNASRGFNYSILASELVSALEVYKSPQARHDEGSIGGMVNVITRKPLDLDPLTIQASAEYQYSELPDEWDPQISALASWSTPDQTFGVLASINSQKRTVRRDGLEAFLTNSSYTVVDQDNNQTEDVYAAWGGGSAIFRQDRERTTANLTLQFKPTDELDMSLNFVNSDMDMDNNNQNYLWIIGGTAVSADDWNAANPTRMVTSGNEVIDATNPEFVTTSDGRQALVGGVFNSADPNAPSGVAIEPIYRKAYVESQVVDFDLEYETDSLTGHFQAGVTSAKGGSSEDVGYWFEAKSRTEVTLGPDLVEVDYLDIDPTDHSVLTMGSARDWVREMTDDEWYMQGDLKFNLNASFISSIETGLKYRNHVIENVRDNGTTDNTDPSWRVISMDEVSGGLTPTLHQETATSGSLTQYAWIDGGLAQQVIHPMFDAGSMVYGFDYNAYYELTEKISAAYVQANIEAGDLTGNFGFRVIQTEQTSKAYQGSDEGGTTTYSLVSQDRTYTDILPSLNLIYNVSDELILRGAASRAMARPTFTNLSANIVINATSGVASAGNPELEPTYSNQLEFGGEWYFQEASILSASIFYKDLDTYVISETQTENIDGENISVTRPSNAAEGADLLGLELQWQQEIYKGLGVITNYTWTDADTPNELELPGNSENQMNIAGYYENDMFGVRLSYNYRDESYGGQISGSQQRTEAYGQWDLTANATINDMFNVYMTGVNLTNETVNISTSDGLPIGFYENGSRYSVGVRVKF
ncbi:TonB-dependent receptor [Teredinibacter sp. KSP-S5-2]|uniref:TonB-dependent receptor n=1 Tax=Teredinibacter sp. KSP-S5-2 TaxID=3034506 RepID=UPI002934ECFB|nr:TonB-dependent receptor [Teredinibacter sp. KSP-S5-2]WNO11201.1 TonB-dependent receptor [Teredinibacter sp. KSP-S5-2]